jgi:hypothetical protein
VDNHVSAGRSATRSTGDAKTRTARQRVVTQSSAVNNRAEAPGGGARFTGSAETRTAGSPAGRGVRAGGSDPRFTGSAETRITMSVDDDLRTHHQGNLHQDDPAPYVERRMRDLGFGGSTQELLDARGPHMVLAWVVFLETHPGRASSPGGYLRQVLQNDQWPAGVSPKSRAVVVQTPYGPQVDLEDEFGGLGTSTPAPEDLDGVGSGFAQAMESPADSIGGAARVPEWVQFYGPVPPPWTMSWVTAVLDSWKEHDPATAAQVGVLINERISDLRGRGMSHIEAYKRAAREVLTQHLGSIAA